MQCPICGAGMRKGRVTLERSTMGVLSDAADVLMGRHGMSSPRFLYFYPEGGTEAECPDLSGCGYRCSKCGGLFMEGTSPEEPLEGVACLSCGKPIPTESSACPGCGWTWETETP